MEEIKLKKSEIILKLQDLGVDVNPGMKKEEMQALLDSKTAPLNHEDNSIVTSPSRPVVDTEAPKSDLDKILAALGTVVDKVSNIEQRVHRMEVGGKDDFKMEIKKEDVQNATAGKAGVDPRIVKIVEDTLGIDFGIEVKGNQDRPGFELTILVPKRLSGVPMAFRPVRDEVTGEYKIDEKTKRVVEEEYWPGDRRSMQLGATASYELIQERCNRIRSFILAFYQKTNKPQPEFRFK